jgi:hypothetical protein
MDGAVNSDVLLGGLTLKNQEAFAEAERAKAKKNSGRSSTRKRGRPRLLNKDDNAAEVCRPLLPCSILQQRNGFFIDQHDSAEEHKYALPNALTDRAKRQPSRP